MIKCLLFDEVRYIWKEHTNNQKCKLKEDKTWTIKSLNHRKKRKRKREKREKKREKREKKERERCMLSFHHQYFTHYFTSISILIMNYNKYIYTYIIHIKSLFIIRCFHFRHKIPTLPNKLRVSQNAYYLF